MLSLIGQFQRKRETTASEDTKIVRAANWLHTVTSFLKEKLKLIKKIFCYLSVFFFLFHNPGVKFNSENKSHRKILFL